MRKFVALAFIQLGFLAACGGGGYVVTTTPPPPSQNIATPGPPNVETLTVDAGPAGAVNTVPAVPSVSCGSWESESVVPLIAPARIRSPVEPVSTSM